MTEESKVQSRVGRTVYVGLRVYSPAHQRAINCPGLSIKLQGFTPQEAHDLIVAAVLGAVPTARIVGGGSATSGKE